MQNNNASSSTSLLNLCTDQSLLSADRPSNRVIRFSRIAKINTVYPRNVFQPARRGKEHEVKRGVTKFLSILLIQFAPIFFSIRFFPSSFRKNDRREESQFNKLKNRRWTIMVESWFCRSFGSIELASSPHTLLTSIYYYSWRAINNIVVNSVLINWNLRGSLFSLLPRPLRRFYNRRFILYTLPVPTEREKKREGRKKEGGGEGFDFTTRRICHIAINDVRNHFCFAAS